MTARIGISLRTAAALAAVIVLLPLLVFVDLEPAQAHEQTVRRCTFDPVELCWNEPVSHTHRVIPDNPPPDTSPRPPTCPDGTTGTPPNCDPIPSDNTNHVPEPTTPVTQCSGSEHRYGNTCHSHSFTPPCGTGTWTPHAGHTPIQRLPCTTTTTTTAPPPCYWPNHSHGDTCHAHTLTPPCGTGTWTPHSGHSPIQRQPCDTTPPTTAPPNDDDSDDSDDEGGECLSGTFVSGNCQPRCPGGQHRHIFVGDMTGCHEIAPDHCGEDEHAHTHAGSCHRNTLERCAPGAAYNGIGCLTMHCADGEHEHTHGSGDCHANGTIHCPDGQHIHPRLESDRSGSRGCHSIDRNHCGPGEHRSGDGDCELIHPPCDDPENNHQHEGGFHTDSVYFACHPRSVDHYSLGWADQVAYAAVCAIPVARILRVLGTTAQWLGGAAGGVTCENWLASLTQDERDRLRAEHDETSNDDLTPTTTAAPTTTEGPPAATPTTAPSTTEGPPAPTSTTEGPPAPTATTAPPVDYCTEWSSFGMLQYPNLGEVVLYINNRPASSIQGTREWATARCRVLLAQGGP